jgi:hypothetical protein
VIFDIVYYFDDCNDDQRLLFPDHLPEIMSRISAIVDGSYRKFWSLSLLLSNQKHISPCVKINSSFFLYPSTQLAWM